MSETETIAIKSDYGNDYCGMGNAFKEQGRREDAVQCYQKGLAVCPGNADLWYKLGTTLLELARLSEAVAALEQAVALKPDFAFAYGNLGNALKEQGRLAEAIQCYQKGLAICPGGADLWYNLGSACLEQKRLSEAVSALKQAVTLKADHVAAYINLGIAFKEQNLPEEAIQCFQSGLNICPASAELWYNLANILFELERMAAAVAAFQQAIALKPDFTAAYYNLGAALEIQRRVEDAIAAYSRGIELDPSDPDIHHRRSQAILLSGNLALGFAEYEWRIKTKENRRFYEWCESKPHWRGEMFSGKRLLVYCEQGLGDAIQFSRYLPQVKARGGIVEFAAWKPLVRLFRDFPGIDDLVELTAESLAEGEFDAIVSLLSLPHIFGTTLRTIPANVPYLAVEESSINAWQKKLNYQDQNFRAGLVWAGNPVNIPGKIRTSGLAAMSPLAGIPGVTFYSLQKGEAAKQAEVPPRGMQLIDLTDNIEDFTDAAALIMNLDLVLSVDTAMAHLAGALGRPVWTLLPSAGCWRWLLAGSDSPWYPTMRLFRQSAPGDWTGVMTEVARELRMLLTTMANKQGEKAGVTV